METLLFILKIVPTLIDAIVAIEKQIPAPGAGALKMDAIKNILLAVDSSYTKYWATIVGVITSLVTLFNKSGTFTTTQKVAAAPVATPAIQNGITN